MVGAGEEEALADWEVGEAFLFFVGELKDIGKNIDGGRRLFQEELHGGVRDDSAAHFATHKVFNVLSNSGETEVVFAGALGETEEKVCGIVVFHELPSFIDDEEAAFLVGADNIPDMGKNNIHSDGAEFVLEVADIKDDHLVVDVDVGLLREDARESTGRVFAKTLGELRAGAAHVEEGVVEVDDGWRGGLVGEGVASDAGASVGVDEGLVEVGFFISG